MALTTLLTGLEPKLGQIVRVSDPADILTATKLVGRELQLNYFENQKFYQNNSNENTNIPQRRTNSGPTIKQ